MRCRNKTQNTVGAKQKKTGRPHGPIGKIRKTFHYAPPPPKGPILLMGGGKKTKTGALLGGG